MSSVTSVLKMKQAIKPRNRCAIKDTVYLVIIIR